MDFFYDGQIRRYVTQFMRIFIGFKYQAGDGTQQSVPVMYGDMTRQVANIIRENSENKLPTVPRIACYITGLDMDTDRLSDPTFVSKVNIRERRYYEDEQTGERVYTGEQGKNVTVERLMPTPFKLTMRADIWTSNTDQKLQLMEQILVLFNPALEIQTTDNYIDWTSLSVVYLTGSSFTSRSIPAGIESDIDISSVDFEIPVWISPPAKVKKLGIVRSIIANIFTEDGDVKNISSLVYNNTDANTVYVNARYPVLLFKANNGQDYDYDLTIIDQYQAIQSLGLDEKEFTNGRKLDWHSVLAASGNFNAGSMIYFRQPNGNEIAGTFAVNPVDSNVLLVTLDQDTIPGNTILSSSNRQSSQLTTIDAIIDPFRYNPIEKFNGLSNIPLGHRFLILEDINTSENVGGLMEHGNDPTDGSSKDPYDGPDGWKALNGSDTVVKANSIIEWNGSGWDILRSPSSLTSPTYVQNLRTGIQYKWDGTQWLKSFEGEYSPGFWRLDPDPA
jgi:hypothetical protein